MSAQDRSMSRVCLITGGTGGIGTAVTSDLLERGDRVLLVVRNKASAQSLINSWTSSYGADHLTVIEADLASLDSVRQLAEEVHRQTDRLDVLIHNAGVFHKSRTVTVDGFETMLAVNYLAPFLLTHLLLDLLRKTAAETGDVRVVCVSSSFQGAGPWNIRDLTATHRFRAIIHYGVTKLALLMFTVELAERLQGTGITANALHPGVVGTAIMEKNTPAFWKFPSRIARQFLLSPKQAKQFYLKLLSPELTGASGRYYSAGVREPIPEKVRNVSHRRQLWDISERLINLPDAARVPPAPIASPEEERPFQLPPLSRLNLALGAGFHLCVGFGLFLFPERLQEWLGLVPAAWGVPTFMTVATMLFLGIGFASGIRRPLERRPLLQLSFLLKTSESALLWWFAGAANVSWWPCVIDVIWWLPLVGALSRIKKHLESERASLTTFDDLLRVCDQNGRSIAELSSERPLLLLCVRHTGCAFCREALADLGAIRSELEESGIGMAVVHMGPDATAESLCDQYGLNGVSRILDGDRSVYRALGLKKGSPRELLPPSVWKRSFEALVREGHRIGKIGDVEQLAGAAVVWKGDLVVVSRSATACDRLDLNEMFECTAQRCPTRLEEVPSLST